MIVNVTDVNDNRPRFALPVDPLVISVDEFQPPGTWVAVVKAFDKDTGNHSSVTYTLNDRNFHIRSYLGTITTKSELYHSQGSSQRFVVTATESTPPRRSARANVVVMINKATPPPRFSREDVAGESVGCVGLSGGGLRSGLLQATCPRIGAAVVVGMMSTYEGLLDHNVVSHTWMLYPGPQWPADWPEVVACRAPSPLMVQFDHDDSLFTMDGMGAADVRIGEMYEGIGQRDRYVGQFYDGPHKFDVEMQDAAFKFLAEHLGDGA